MNKDTTIRQEKKHYYKKSFKKKSMKRQKKRMMVKSPEFESIDSEEFFSIDGDDDQLEPSQKTLKMGSDVYQTDIKMSISQVETLKQEGDPRERTRKVVNKKKKVKKVINVFSPLRDKSPRTARKKKNEIKDLLKSRNDFDEKPVISVQKVNNLSTSQNNYGRFRRKSVESLQLLKMISNKASSPKNTGHKKSSYEEEEEDKNMRKFKSSSRMTPKKLHDDKFLTPVVPGSKEYVYNDLQGSRMFNKNITTPSSSSSNNYNTNQFGHHNHYLNPDSNSINQFRIKPDKVKSSSNLSKEDSNKRPYKFNLSSENDDQSDLDQNGKGKQPRLKMTRSSKSNYREDGRDGSKDGNLDLGAIWERDVVEEISPNDRQEGLKFHRRNLKRKSSKKLKKENVRLKLELENAKYYLEREKKKSKRLAEKKKNLKQLKLKRSFSNSPVMSVKNPDNKVISDFRKSQLHMVNKNPDESYMEGMSRYISRKMSNSQMSNNPYYMNDDSFANEYIEGDRSKQSDEDESMVDDNIENFYLDDEKKYANDKMHDVRYQFTTYRVRDLRDAMRGNVLQKTKVKNMRESVFLNLESVQYIALGDPHLMDDASFSENSSSDSEPDDVTSQNFGKLRSYTRKKIRDHKRKEKIFITKFSPDCSYFAIANSVGVLCVLKVITDMANRSGYLFESDYSGLKREGDCKDILDISWTNNSQLIMVLYLDKKLTLWSLEQKSIVQTIAYNEIASCVSFHPMEDAIFATGCLDKILRVSEVTEGNVLDWVQTHDHITSIKFESKGNYVVVGFSKGVCRVYRSIAKFQYITDFACRNSNVSQKKGKKVINIEFLNDQEFLVNTNDSRIRLFRFGVENGIVQYNVPHLELKYKGHTNNKYPLKMSTNKNIIICPSENGAVFAWNKIKKKVEDGFFFKDKKITNKQHEYFYPFKKPRKRTLMGRKKKRKCTSAVMASDKLLEMYNKRLSKRKTRVENLIVCVSGDGHIKVLKEMVEARDKDQKKNQD